MAIPAGTLTYETGDALGVWPRNSESLVGEWLERTGLDGAATIDLPAVGSVRLGDALRDHLEIAKVTPDLVRFVVARTGDVDLEAMMLPENRGAFDEWAWGRQSVDLLAEHPVRATVQEWLEVLTPLRPRLYSISSSPRQHPDEIQLTVSAVRYNLHGTPRRGVCSTYLADHAHDGDVRVFVRRSSSFRPPTDPSTPLVMVGPGTGIAPFRAFLQDRRARGHDGPKLAVLRRATRGHRLLLPRRARRAARRRRADAARCRLLPRPGGEGVRPGPDARTRRRAVPVVAARRGLLRVRRRGPYGPRRARCAGRGGREHGRLAPHSAETYVQALAADRRYLRDVY